MIRLIRFNLFSFASRLTTYVIPLITLVVVSLTAGILSILPGSNFLEKSLALPLLFFFSMIFLIQSTIIFFKAPQEESMLPIVFSKPFSKHLLFTSNLISNAITILLFSIYISSLFTIIGTIDGGMTSHELGTFFASSLIGNIIIMSIFGSLISLTCLILSSSWVTLLWMMIVFIIPISSFIGQASFNKKFRSIDTFRYEVPSADGSFNNQSADSIYLDVRNENNPLDLQTLAWNEAKNNHYSTFAWFDPWYQLSNLYSVFTPKELDTSMAKWNTSTISLDDAYEVTLLNNVSGQTETYKVIANHMSVLSVTEKNLEFITSSLDYLTKVNDASSGIKSLPFERQLYLFHKSLGNGDTNAILRNFDDDLTHAKNDQQSTVENSINDYDLKAYMYFKDNGLVGATSTNIDWDNISSDNYKHVVLINGDKVNVFVPSNFIDTKWIVLMWSLLLVGTSVTGIWIYTRKEIIS